MTPPDPAALPLRDIHLPAPVSWWPLAPGWWFAAGLLALAAAGLLALWLRRRRLRARHAALAELTDIERAFSADGDGHACARRLSRLLRQLALLRAEPGMAAATGEQWLRIMRELGGEPLPPAVQPVFLIAPYSPATARAIDAADYHAAGVVLRNWIGRLPLKPAARHRAR